MNKGVSINEGVNRKKEIQEREIVEMWKHMDEKLEMKAKSLNLTAINVKSILHHMIKNPQVISVIMGLDKSSVITDLKLTRSRTKHLSGLETHVDVKEGDTVSLSRASRTFLDVDYSTNEEEDYDYLPEQDDASEAEAENEGNVTEVSFEILNNAFQTEIDIGDDDVAPALHTRSKHESNVYSENVPNFSDDVLLYTAVDDPEYVEFISNLNDPSKYDLDETEDPEYNFLSDADAEDITEEYEVRKDRATEISLREIENLLQDLLEAHLLPSPQYLEQTIDSVKDENRSSQSVRQDDHKLNMKKAKTALAGSLPGNAEPATILVDASMDDFQKVSTISSSLLCASVKNPPLFSFYELQQLVAQFEKHVQLLTQFAVGCYFEKTMVKTYNGFQVMINELNNYCLQRPEHSVFNVVNLEACIATCHDAIECETISDFTRRKSKKLQFPLAKTVFVLSRSKALLFPELLPQVRMKMFPTFYPYFIREEECLLALGLYQFAHLKHLSGKRKCYALISQHLLANKMQSQIRLHLKNFRCSNQPVHTLFVKAETEIINMIFPLENRSTAIFGPPYLWPRHLQPKWLKELVDKQQYDLECRNLALDGLTVTKIRSDRDSPSVDRPDSDCNLLSNSLLEYREVDAKNWSFNRSVTSTPIVASTDNSSTELACNSARMNRPMNTTFASIGSEYTEIARIPSSPVRNLLLFASTAVCNEVTSPSLVDSDESVVMLPVNRRSLPIPHYSVLVSVGYNRLPSPSSYPLIVPSPSSWDFSPSTSCHPRIKSAANGESLTACFQRSTIISSASESVDPVKNVNMISAVRFAPFKKIPSTEKSDINEFEGSLDSDRYEIEAVDKINGNIVSGVSSEEIMVDSSSLSNVKNSICLVQSSGKTKHNNSDDVSSYFNTPDLEYSYSMEADLYHRNVGMKYNISSYSSAMIIEKNKKISGVIKGYNHKDCQENHSTQHINRNPLHSSCSDSETSCDMPECSSLIYQSKWVPNAQNEDIECFSPARYVYYLYFIFVLCGWN
ncbi:GON-4-like protein [Dirofilaria immitis]